MTRRKGLHTTSHDLHASASDSDFAKGASYKKPYLQGVSHTNDLDPGKGASHKQPRFAWGCPHTNDLGLPILPHTEKPSFAGGFPYKSFGFCKRWLVQTAKICRQFPRSRAIADNVP